MIRTASRLFLCAFALSAVAYGDAATTFYGTTAGHPFFNRPDDTGTATTVATRYDMQPFILNASSDCSIESVQEGAFDGMIFLYRNSFDPSDPTANLIAAADDGPDFGVGTSRIEPLTLSAADDYFLVTAGFYASGSGTFSNQVVCDDPTTRVLVGYGIFGDNHPSDYDGRRAQLLEGRFEVSVTGFNFAATPFVGRTAPLASNDSAIFWFFQPANFELLIKVVDGCALNDRFWVFYAATTNVAFTIVVDDTFTGARKTYSNLLGSTANIARTDSNAFATCL